MMRAIALVSVVVTVLSGCGYPTARGFVRPATTEAIVTDEFINGVGGDPAVDYRYLVAGHSYDGYAVAGENYHRRLHEGDRVTIVVDQSRPEKSCLCRTRR